MTTTSAPAIDLGEVADRIEALRYAQAKEREWKEIGKAIRSEIEQAMGGPDGEAETGTVGGRPVVAWTRSTRTALDQSRLKAEAPDVHARFLATTTLRRFVLLEEP